jgi:hypothetical protein
MQGGNTMRIDSSVLSMTASSSQIVNNTREETLKTWNGNRRPDFEGINTNQQPQKIQITIPQDILDISKQGLDELSKQAKLASSGTVEEDDYVLYELGDKDKQKIEMLQRMIEALTGKKFKFIVPEKIRLNKAGSLEMKLPPAQTAATVTRAPERAGWGLEYDLHETHYEKQTMSFSAQGVVKTADGREIQLDVELNLSREFASRKDVSLRMGDAVRVDPLVINFNSPSARLTENKISFDLDKDGTSEQMSFVAGGSGFLALDMNNDGIVNDGSELFGPQSGNGFADLSAYDGDGNGWIDEGDDIYDRLRIWTKDEQGNDQLFALGQKGIGAIYLGSAAASFDLKGTQNQLLGDIGSTGIFLRENGTAGTVQHIDLAI